MVHQGIRTTQSLTVTHGYSVQGELKTLIDLTLQKPEISTGSINHLARNGLAFQLYTVAVSYSWYFHLSELGVCKGRA